MINVVFKNKFEGFFNVGGLGSSGSFLELYKSCTRKLSRAIHALKIKLPATFAVSSETS